MSTGPGRQSQKSGNDSLNQLAGRDIVNHGLTVSDVREICSLSLKAELGTITSHAADVAISRVESFTDGITARLSDVEDWVIQRFGDPDVQFALGDAQKAYARSGREEHRRTLIELVVSRAKLDSGEVQATAVAQAIESVRLLTGGQVRALSMMWFLVDTYSPNVVDEETFYAYSEQIIKPLYMHPLPTASEVNHLATTNCSSIASDSYLLEKIIGRQVFPLLTNAFHKEEAGSDLQEVWDDLVSMEIIGVYSDACSPKLYKPLVYNLNSVAEAIDARFESSTLVASLSGYLMNRLVSLGTAEEILSAIHPVWSTVTEHWNSSGLKHLRLTAVGTVIAHAYMREITGQPLNLDDWIPR